MPALLTPRRARWLLGGYVLAMGAVVFQPMPRTAVGSVDLGYRVIELLGLTSVVTPTMVEFALNIALFVPLTFLGSAIERRVVWEQWVGVALITSGTIEFVQLMGLPGRSASLLDLASNTLGGLLGALAARTLLREREQRSPTMGSVEAPVAMPNKE